MSARPSTTPLIVLAALVMIGAVAVPLSRAKQQAKKAPLMGVSMASHLAAVASEQSGTIVEILAKPGDRIRKGDALFRLSSKLQQLEVARLRALVDSQLERDRAKANLTHAREKSDRMRELSKSKVASTAKASEAELETQLAQLTVGKAEFEHVQLGNELNKAEELLAQRSPRSPLTGIVTKHFKQLGETADQLDPVVEVMSLDPLWVQFECPVAREKEFVLGSKVQVRPVVGRHEARIATIVYVSRQAAVAGHTFSVRVALPNEDYAWRSGLKMSVETIAPSTAKPAGGK